MFTLDRSCRNKKSTHDNRCVKYAQIINSFCKKTNIPIDRIHYGIIVSFFILHISNISYFKFRKRVKSRNLTNIGKFFNHVHLFYSIKESENHKQKLRKNTSRFDNVKIFHIKTCIFILIQARICQNNTTIS